MSEKRPYMWRLTDVYTVTNPTKENFLLELDSGLLRLDAGRSVRLTGNALEHPQVASLLKAEKLKAEKFDWRKRQKRASYVKQNVQ